MRYREWEVQHNREMKFDVTGSCVKRQTAKMTSEFVFFSSNPSLNHIKIQNCLLLFATNTNIFTRAKNRRQKFHFCRLTYDHVTSNLISLMKLTSLERMISSIIECYSQHTKRSGTNIFHTVTHE